LDASSDLTPVDPDSYSARRFTAAGVFFATRRVGILAEMEFVSAKRRWFVTFRP
jgi:hypothetical protein